MTALERLCKAEGVQGGVIHTYNRLFSNALRRSVELADMDAHGLSDLATECVNAGAFDLAKLASKASIAHLSFSKV